LSYGTHWVAKFGGVVARNWVWVAGWGDYVAIMGGFLVWDPISAHISGGRNGENHNEYGVVRSGLEPRQIAGGKFADSVSAMLMVRQQISYLSDRPYFGVLDS